MTEHRTEEEDDGRTFVVFRLGDENYGFDVHSTREIVAHARVTPLPRAPRWVRGALNLRGRVTPVLDIGMCFGLAPRQESPTSRIVITETQLAGEDFLAGIWVDAVAGVSELSKTNVEPPPRLGKDTTAEYIAGIGRQDHGFFVILELQRLLSSAQFSAAANSIDPELLEETRD